MLPFVVVDAAKIAPLQPFGVCCAIAFFVWDSVLMKMAVRRGFSSRDFRVLTVGLGVLGWGFAWGVDAVFYRGSGGFSSTGAILGATVAAILWTRIGVEKDAETARWRLARRREPHSLLAVSEVILATWPLAHAIGRVGCALIHDHVGRSVAPGTLGSLFAVGFPRSAEDGRDLVLGPLHVVTGASDVRFDLGLLECIFLAALALFFIRRWKREVPVPMGWFTMVFCLGYGSVRFLLDFLRATDVTAAEPRLAGLTFAQYWSLAVIALGVTLLVKRRRRHSPTRSRVAAGAAFLVFSFSSIARSEAAERWVDRPMTLHRLVFAGDVGLGVGHAGAAPRSFTGAGLNLEGAIGVTETVELGLRTGVRFGDEGRIVRADGYGRTLWTETYGTGGDTFANPEARVRWVFYTGSIAEVGLDGRLYLPFETNTNVGMMIGVPLAFHVADSVRIDTGAYVPLIFANRTFNGVSIPGYFWFQPSPQLWLGPMTALRFLGNGGGPHDGHLLLGFGLGYQVANAVDLKTWFLFPAIDDNPGHNFGLGFGVEFRIGD